MLWKIRWTDPRISLSIVISLCLLSCSSNDNGKNTPLSNTDSQKVASNDYTSLHVPLPFSGIWVYEKYVNNIKRDKSPRLFQHLAESIIIPDSTLQPATSISGFHEGGPDSTIVKIGNNYALYNKVLSGRPRPIEIISSDKIKIGDQIFIKLKHPNENRYDWNILEELLFSGHYQLDNGKDVEFKIDGHVAGLDSFSRYEPMIDYIGPGMDVDQVQLGVTENQMETFGFKFKTDSLFIYRLHCVLGYDSVTKDCGVVEFGDLRYKLLRKG